MERGTSHHVSRVRPANARRRRREAWRLRWARSQRPFALVVSEELYAFVAADFDALASGVNADVRALPTASVPMEVCTSACRRCYEMPFESTSATDWPVVAAVTHSSCELRRRVPDVRVASVDLCRTCKCTKQNRDVHRLHEMRIEARHGGLARSRCGSKSGQGEQSALCPCTDTPRQLGEPAPRPGGPAHERVRRRNACNARRADRLNLPRVRTRMSPSAAALAP